MDSRRVDDEGTPDVYRDLIDKLKREGSVDEPIKEPYSMDWRAERELVPAMLSRISKQPSWVPRIGELVLFVRRLEGREEICFEEASHEYKVYSLDDRQFKDHPRWEAGVIAQVNAERVEIADLVKETPDKEYQVNYSGFRVEPFPDPNSDEKPYSKQYKYVPLHYTRPFVFWAEFLRGKPESTWHPTIKHAFTAMSTLSLIEKYHFKGTWPTASVLCKGICIGSEMVLVGDVVRLTPTSGSTTMTDVLRITSIRLEMTDLDKASDNDRDEGHPYNLGAHIYGKAYTLDATRSLSGIPIPESSLPADMAGYLNWYPRHDLGKSCRIPFSRVAGRIHNHEAMLLWFPGPQHAADGIADDDAGDDYTPDLSHGLSGLLRAREYSQTHYRRIQGGKKWFWGDSRADALDLETLNGVEVGRHDVERDPKKWRKDIRVMEGVAGEAERVESKRAAELESRLRGFSLESGMVRSAMQADIEMQGLSGSGNERSASEAVEEEGLRRKGSRSAAEVEGEVNLDDQEMDVDQFVDELAGGIAFSGRSGEADESEDEESVVVLEERSTPKKQRLQVVID